jgi:hypothetical protein
LWKSAPTGWVAYRVPRDAGDHLHHPGAAHGLHIFLVLDQDTQRLVHGRRFELGLVQRHERGHPIERLGDAGLLVELGGAQLLNEGRRLLGEPPRRLGHLRGHDPQFLVEVRQIDPEIQTAPLERIVQLSRPVRRDDHDRRNLCADRPELGDGDLKIGEELQQEALELLVGAIELVDEQHRTPRRGAAQCLEQRAFEQKACVEQLARCRPPVDRA